MNHKLTLLFLTSVEQTVSIKIPSNAGEQLAVRGNDYPNSRRKKCYQADALPKCPVLMPIVTSWHQKTHEGKSI